MHHLAYDCGLVTGFVDLSTFLQVADANVDHLFGHQPIVFSTPVAEVDTSYTSGGSQGSQGAQGAQGAQGSQGSGYQEAQGAQGAT